MSAIPAPPPPPGPAWWLIVPVCAAGACAVVFGVWMMLGARALDKPVPTGRLGAFVRWRNGFTPPTRLALGLAAFLVGYHAASWVSPDPWLPLRIPPEMWYFVVLGAGALIAGSLWVDRRAERG